MPGLVAELADLPPRLTLDGELVPFGEDKLPSFPRLCQRMLHRRPGIPVAYMIFDVLERDGLAPLNWPYRQRRELLKELNLHGSHWDTAMAFEDGERLFRCVHGIGLEGVVAKKPGHRYRPGERLWIKVKNRDYWRYPLERKSARNLRRTPSIFATR